MVLQIVLRQPYAWKLKYIHELHAANPTLNKGDLKDVVGLGISTKVIREYWNLFVEPKPVYQIKKWDEVMKEE